MSDRRKIIIEKIIRSFQGVKRKMMSKVQVLPKKFLVTPAQGQIIFIVGHNPGIGIKKIALKLNITSSAATQLVDGLVKDGYLIRENNPADRRAINISLSKKTIEKRREMRKRFAEQFSEIFENLSDNELEELSGLSKKIAGDESTFKIN